MDEIVEISDTEENSDANNQCSNESPGGRVMSINKNMIKLVDIDSIIKSKSPSTASAAVSPSTVLRPLNPMQGPGAPYKKLLLPTSFLSPNNGLKPHSLQAIQFEGSKNIYLLNIDKRYIQATSEAAKITSTSTLVPISSSITAVVPVCSSATFPTIVPTSAPIPTLVSSSAIPTLLLASTPSPAIMPASAPISTFAPTASSHTAPTKVRTIHYKCLQFKKKGRKIDCEGFSSNDRLGFYGSEEKRSLRCLRMLNMHIKVRENHLSSLISQRLEYAKKIKLSNRKVNDVKKVKHSKTAVNIEETNRTRRKGSSKLAKNVNRLQKRRRANVKQKCLHNIKLSDNLTSFYNIKISTTQDECCQFQWVQLPTNYEKLTYSQLMNAKNCSNIYYVDSTNIHDVDNLKRMEPSSNIYFINENNLVTDYYMDSIPFLKDQVKVIDKSVFNKYKNRIEPKPTMINDDKRSAMSRKKAFNSFLTKFHNRIKKNKPVET